MNMFLILLLRGKTLMIWCARQLRHQKLKLLRCGLERMIYFVGSDPNSFVVSVLLFFLYYWSDTILRIPSRPSALVGTLSFLQSMWDRPKSTPLWGPAFLVAHRLVSTPFGEQREGWRLAHRYLVMIPFVTIQIHR